MLNKLLFPDGFNLLDLACGTGFVITEAIRKGRLSNIIGIDGSEGSPVVLPILPVLHHLTLQEYLVILLLSEEVLLLLKLSQTGIQ